MAGASVGKKSKLTRKDLFDYFARERLRLNEGIINEVLSRFANAIPGWRDLLSQSFLSDEMKEKYTVLFTERCARLKL